MGTPDSPGTFAAFQQFHGDLLTRAPAQGSLAGAVADAAPLGAVTFTTPLGSATWRAQDTVEITVTPAGEPIPLDADVPHTTVELPLEAWWGLMRDYETIPGLLISGRASVSSGKPGRATRWEAPLRAILHDIPVYNEATIDLRDRNGSPLDPSRAFTLTELEQDPETAVHFLSAAGFMAVRSVFTPEEVRQFQEAVDQLAAEATEGDQASWWGKNKDGDSVLTRVLRGYTQPVLRALVDDPRVRTIIDCYGEHMEVPIPDELDGVTVIYKRPDMVEGLADLPWHRDCGMGGHAHMCPSLVMSIYVTPGTSETGELRVLPGSHTTSAPFLDERSSGEIGIGVPMQPGDVSLHITDVMHASMPPTASEGPHRIAVLLPFTRPVPSTHLEGIRHYNDALLGSEDGQVTRLGG